MYFAQLTRIDTHGSIGKYEQSQDETDLKISYSSAVKVTGGVNTFSWKCSAVVNRDMFLRMGSM